MDPVIVKLISVKIGRYEMALIAVESDAKKDSSGFTTPGPGGDEEGFADRS
jgi:hypothetical protein